MKNSSLFYYLILETLRNIKEVMENSSLFYYLILETLRKIPKLHLISWYGYFVERQSFRIVLAFYNSSLKFFTLREKLSNKSSYLINSCEVVEWQVNPFQVAWIFNNFFNRGDEFIPLSDYIVAQPNGVCATLSNFTGLLLKPE